MVAGSCLLTIWEAVVIGRFLWLFCTVLHYSTCYWAWQLATVRWWDKHCHFSSCTVLRTFDWSLSVIPIQLHTPMKYHLRFCPLWLPDIDQKPITSDLIFHFLSFTSIHCMVTPRNASFVISTVHLSDVVETNPEAAFIIAGKLAVFFTTNHANYLDICFQLTHPTWKLIV